MASRMIALLLITSLLVGPVALGRDIHVSPAGTPQGDGTEAKPLDIFTALGANSPAQPGDTILLADGRYDGKMEGTKRIPIPLLVSGTKKAPVVIKPAPGASAHLNGAVELRSSYAHYMGLDIGDLAWDPWQKKHQVPTALNALGGEGASVINCNIFGGAMGTGLWSPARNLTLYGCLVHDFGYLAEGGRGHGHAFYTQNETGTKTIERCMAYRGCGWNLHIYTQGGQIKGFDVIENIMYIAGAYKEGQTMDNYLCCGYPPADRIRYIRNVGYQPLDVQTWRANARLANFKPVVNGTGEVIGNTFHGAYYGLSLGNWKKMTVTDNTIWATGILAEINSAPTGSAIPEQKEKPDLAGYTLDRNTYIDNGKPTPFNYGNAEKPDPKNLLTFAQWQALGLDKNSAVLPGKAGKPTGTQVFVFGNKYQENRANVGVFNWDGLKEVEVDLAKAVAKGATVRIYNCLDIAQTIAQAKPILTLTYAGGPIALPLRGDKISPDFDAFLILPGE